MNGFAGVGLLVLEVLSRTAHALCAQPPTRPRLGGGWECQTSPNLRPVTWKVSANHALSSHGVAEAANCTIWPQGRTPQGGKADAVGCMGETVLSSDGVCLAKVEKPGSLQRCSQYQVEAAQTPTQQPIL